MITTHILDTTLGKPARGVAISLKKFNGVDWKPVGQGATDDDGRLKTVTAPGAVGRRTRPACRAARRGGRGSCRCP